MTSSKGRPTDPKLREEVKEDIKNETNKDGGGKGSWSAWKAAKLSKEYEAKGGGYENEAGSKNEPKKGAPEPKSSGKREREEAQSGESGPQEKKHKQHDQKDADDGQKATKKAASRKTKKESKPKREGTRKSTRQRKTAKK